MASTRESFVAALREHLGPGWALEDAEGGGFLLVRRRGAREVPERWLTASRAHPRAFLDRVEKVADEMRAEIDPRGAEREQTIAALREKLSKAEAELAGARAIIADLFRQAREGATLEP